jgi:hypothetical protein
MPVAFDAMVRLPTPLLSDAGLPNKPTYPRATERSQMATRRRRRCLSDRFPCNTGRDKLLEPVESAKRQV